MDIPTRKKKVKHLNLKKFCSKIFDKRCVTERYQLSTHYVY